MNALEAAQTYFDYHKSHPADIDEHLDTLLEYGKKCETITEMGTRGIVSLWAFVLAQPKKLTAIDIYPPDYFLHDEGQTLATVERVALNMSTEFKFILGNTLEIEIEETDLLFIDTLHTYAQLSQELLLHGDKAKKYLIFHDTESCGEYVNDSYGNLVGGLKYAINDFMVANLGIWEIDQIFTNNNGLTILRRVN